jgi:hypothetical protein
MPWTNKDFEPQILSDALLSAMKQTLAKAPNLIQSSDPTVEAKDMQEYEGRMKVSGLEDLNCLCYVSVINFYLNQGDLDRRKGTKGGLVIYMEAENAGKFFKALELPFADDEDDNSMIAACGQFTQMIADGLKKELSGHGYAPLFLSPPSNYKNKVLEGLEISPGQKTKHTIAFNYFKHKVIAADLTLAPVPKK